MLACEHDALLNKEVCHFMNCLQHNMHDHLSARGALGFYADHGLGTHCGPCARHMIAAVSGDT